MTPLEWGVVLIVAVAGALLGQLVRAPLWALVGPLVAVGAVSLAWQSLPEAPPALRLTAQVIVGMAVGSRIRFDFARTLRRDLVPAVVGTVVIVGACASLASLFVLTGSANLPTAVFGMMPGGVGEMTAAASSTGGSPAVVVSMHLVRLFLVILFVRMALSWYDKRHPPEQPPPGGAGS